MALVDQGCQVLSTRGQTIYFSTFLLFYSSSFLIFKLFFFKFLLLPFLLVYSRLFYLSTFCLSTFLPSTVYCLLFFCLLSPVYCHLTSIIHHQSSINSHLINCISLEQGWISQISLTVCSKCNFSLTNEYIKVRASTRKCVSPP